MPAYFRYKSDWKSLFDAIDRNGGGSLEQEEFRLGLRTRARIPLATLSDAEVRRLFDVIETYTGDGAIHPAEFACVLHRARLFVVTAFDIPHEEQRPLQEARTTAEYGEGQAAPPQAGWILLQKWWYHPRATQRPAHTRATRV